MLDPGRIVARMELLGISQGKLARELGMSQQAISRVIRGEVREPRRIHRMAAVLQTTIGYLECLTDDPDADVRPPPPEPRVQFVTLQVALPSEAALADMFEAQLRVFGKLKGAELARALARQLPRGLAQLREVPLIEPSAVPDEAPSDAEHLRPDRSEAA